MHVVDATTHGHRAPTGSETGVLAAEQLKVAKQGVTDGGFASASIAPILVAAVLQAIAINQGGLRG